MRSDAMSMRAHILQVTGYLVCFVSALCAEEDVWSVSAKVDAHFKQTWREAGAEPAPLASDSVFLRRAYIDLTGVIPSVGEVHQFLNDSRADKRARLIDRLLKKPNHATHLANVWREVMLPSTNNTIGAGGAEAFENWLRGKFADNTRYDELVRDVVLATGNVGQSGPTLFYTSLRLRPEELAASTSRIFLGVQIQCAQCHDHPFDHWSQDDFWGYAAFFAQLQRPNQEGRLPSAVADTNSGEVKLPDTQRVVAPRFLGNRQPLKQVRKTRRAELASWLTSKSNPYFAQATVNRAWALMFGRGLVDPVDDFGSHNPPSQPQVLQVLATDLAENGFNLKRLFRLIANSKVYQLSSELQPDEEIDSRLFRAMPVKSLTAEQIYDCLAVATGRREARGAAQQRRTQEKRNFIAKFEAPTQGATEFQAGIPQELTMLNGQLVADATDLIKSDLLAALIDAPFFSDEERIETLFLATLTRPPTEPERRRFAEYIKDGGPSKDSKEALADALWVLLNSSEFILNH